MAPPPTPQTMNERILATADKLFYLQGIRAIGVDTIAAEIGISKRTLYNHFPSKDALIAAYLERRFVQPRPSDKPPAEQILATFDSLERRVELVDRHGHLDDGLRLVLLAVIGARLQHVAARLRGDRADPAQRDLDIGNF